MKQERVRKGSEREAKSERWRNKAKEWQNEQKSEDGLMKVGDNEKPECADCVYNPPGC